MKFCIVTHVVHKFNDGKIYGYAPYINEMNIWVKNVDKVYIIAPKSKEELSEIDAPYIHSNIHFIEIPSLHFKSLKNIGLSFVNSLKIIFILFKAFKKVDHIHLRCPGNIGLLGVLVQLFFPKIKKTAKYAGNWDLKAKQPFSYKIQKELLRNTFFSRKMQTIVYGNWQNSTKNIKSFFTATYSENEKIFCEPRNLSKTIKFLFVGTLSIGKNPVYAIDIVKKLKKANPDVLLEIYGDGFLKSEIETKINSEKLNDFVFLKGNVNKEKMKAIYQNAHFLVLPSKSEGWPKVVAEAMFWGCLPISTKVSCVPDMLGYGERGLLLKENLEEDVQQIVDLITNQESFSKKCTKGILWSQQYTLERFEREINKQV
jgi:glycosyltransferase involved in cell wall biosynthesis